MQLKQSFTATAHYENEMELNTLIEACHRTIDWSVQLYFRTLKKGLPLFIDKIVKEEKTGFCEAFNTFFLNDLEMAQLIQDVEDHLNNELISVRNKWISHVKFTPSTVVPSLEFINQLVGEQKTTIKLTNHVNKTICQLTTKNLSALAPTFVPKPIIGKANCTIAQKLSKAIGVDSGKCCREAGVLLEKQLLGLLDCVEQDLKRNLKYQLAEQLYGWFDRYVMETEGYEDRLINC